MIKIHIIFHSVHGHVAELAQDIAKGAESIAETEVRLFQVPETLSESVLDTMNALETKKSMAHIPVAKITDLTDCQGLILGAPSYFGQISGQMLSFLDGAGELWASGKTVDIVGSAFSAQGDQNGGADEVIRGFHTILLHFGCVLVGCPTFLAVSEAHCHHKISGGSSYGAFSTCGEGQGRPSSETEKKVAFSQGKRVAEITHKIWKFN